jgi:hypothetical protein
MDRPRLVQALAGQRGYCESRSPLYAAVLAGLQSDAEASAPWLDAAQGAWHGRNFAVDWEAAHLLLAGMHYWALKGEAPELAAVYPSCGGTGADAAGAARAFLARAPDEFWQHLAAAHVQTNEVGRSVPWMLAAAAAFGARALPFNLVELGASAGLNLVGDWLEHRCHFTAGNGVPATPPAGWNRRPHRVLARAGLDLEPRRLADPHDRLWLKACVWADDLARLGRLEEAIKAFLKRERTIRLEQCTFEEAPAWLSAHCPPRERQGLLVFNSIATVYLDDAAYARLQAGMAQALAPWGDRGFWAEYERPRGGDGPLELRIHRPAGGALRTRLLASGAPRPTVMRLHEMTPWPLN